MRYLFVMFMAAFLLIAGAFSVFAQELLPLEDSAMAMLVEDDGEAAAAFFQRRPASELTLTNVMAYVVQEAARVGIPVETVALILLLPLLATLVAFVRNIVGLPTLDLLVPVTFSIALLATGPKVGVVLLVSLLLASILARLLLKHIRIMQLPKVALSMLVVSFGILGALIASTAGGFVAVRHVSIVPILLFILLSERMIRLQFENSLPRTVGIAVTTLGLGAVGFYLLSSIELREAILLYPELILLLIPINVVIGRYFGLRLTEYIRFAPIARQAR